MTTITCDACGKKKDHSMKQEPANAWCPICQDITRMKYSDDQDGVQCIRCRNWFDVPPGFSGTGSAGAK